MDRTAIESRLTDPVMLDYGIYLKVDQLYAAQKPFEDLCNEDELQFQIVHQTEELWMKLIAYTLLNIRDYMREKNANRVVTLFGRVNRLMRLMIEQLDILETMSPKEYQAIRLQLGNGSGQESPGFNVLLEMPPHLWAAFRDAYLDGRTVRDIYDHGYTHDDAYVVAESMIEYDELFQKFRANHIYLIHRSIGMGAASLKGRSVDLLQAGVRHRFFPELWDVRWQMTDDWGGAYGKKRESLSSGDGA